MLPVAQLARLEGRMTTGIGGGSDDDLGDATRRLSVPLCLNPDFGRCVRRYLGREIDDAPLARLACDRGRLARLVAQVVTYPHALGGIDIEGRGLHWILER